MIVKTRQLLTAPGGGFSNCAPRPGPPRGIMQGPGDQGAGFCHLRIPASSEMQPWVEHFWLVTWDLLGKAPNVAETLPHPNCYLVFESGIREQGGRAPVYEKFEAAGVTTGKFTRKMEGWGQVFGLKFIPGGLRPFLSGPASRLTNRVVPAEQVFGTGILELGSTIGRLRDPLEMAERATGYFKSASMPSPDPNVALSAQLVRLIQSDASILTVDSLARRSGYSARSLQRLFREYVGVAPKWTIRRYRLHELLDRLRTEPMQNIAELACELGYTDQSHLCHDFRRISGYTPQQYSRRVRN